MAVNMAVLRTFDTFIEVFCANDDTMRTAGPPTKMPDKNVRTATAARLLTTSNSRNIVGAALIRKIAQMVAGVSVTS